jgi:hypothetical protein
VRTALDPTDVTASAEPEASHAANGGAP